MIYGTSCGQDKLFLKVNEKQKSDIFLPRGISYSKYCNLLRDEQEFMKKANIIKYRSQLIAKMTHVHKQ